MRNVLFLILVSLFAMQAVLAHDAKMALKPCETIAKACKHTGFAHKKDSEKFWTDCMKPIILGQTVKGVKIDADTVKSCRADKIEKMKQEITEFENASK